LSPGLLLYKYNQSVLQRVLVRRILAISNCRQDENRSSSANGLDIIGSGLCHLPFTVWRNEKIDWLQQSRFAAATFFIIYPVL
jgi:hypothetical protein